MASRAKLTYHFAWSLGGLVAWCLGWLGGLVAHCLETLGACHRHFDGLGRFDVKMHGFKVPKSAHFDGFGVFKT